MIFKANQLVGINYTINYYLGVARDSNINKSQGWVSVAQGNDGNVDIWGLSDGLMVLSRVQHNQ